MICSENEVSIITNEYNIRNDVVCNNFYSNNINNKRYSKQSNLDN